MAPSLPFVMAAANFAKCKERETIFLLFSSDLFHPGRGLPLPVRLQEGRPRDLGGLGGWAQLCPPGDNGGHDDDDINGLTSPSETLSQRCHGECKGAGVKSTSI